MKFAFIAIIVIHGLIHLTGFVKAFKLAPVKQLSQDITRPFGALWLAAAILFLLSAIFFSVSQRWWWIYSLTGILLSQFLIIRSWNDARYGTIANVVVLIISCIGFAVWYLDH